MKNNVLRIHEENKDDAMLSFLQHDGLEELFTINRMNLSLSLRRCLSSTNLIERPNSAMQQRIRNVKRWRDGTMVLR